jgi:uncharacterized membrane-anchored protein YhcB (DUF1043 family)
MKWRNVKYVFITIVLIYVICINLLKKEMEKEKSEFDYKKDELKYNFNEITNLVSKINPRLIVTMLILFGMGLVLGYILGGKYGC